MTNVVYEWSFKYEGVTTDYRVLGDGTYGTVQWKEDESSWQNYFILPHPPSVAEELASELARRYP